LLTDSGTVPEETLYFKKPCVTIRESTERPEIIEAGSNILSGLEPENILRATESITSGKPDWQWNEALGDGKTARKVINILHGKLY
jgi:UDP-N-acetylglucosamine 2-epimerase (non-hydrolysing)